VPAVMAKRKAFF